MLKLRLGLRIMTRAYCKRRTNLFFLFLCIYCCTSCSYHEMKYERLFERADICVEWSDINEFKLDGARFTTLMAGDFRNYVDDNVPNRLVARVIVGKLVVMHGDYDLPQKAIVARLKNLGFKRVVCQVASSSDVLNISYDSDEFEALSASGKSR